MESDARSAASQTGPLWAAKSGPFKLDLTTPGTGTLPPLQPAKPTAWLERRLTRRPQDKLAVFSELGDSLQHEEPDNLLAVRYYVLAAYLRERHDQACVLLRVEDIEGILGGPLHRVAHLVDLFWSDRASYAGAWRSAGFRARRRGLPRGIVAFLNDSVPAEDGPEQEALRSAAESAWLAGATWVPLRLPDLLPGESAASHERETGGMERARDRDRRDEIGGRREGPKKGAGRGRALAEVRSHIQETWHEDVLRYGTVAPPGLEGTSAALEPALTFLGRWGCSACERSGRRMPISDACAECRRFNDNSSRIRK